MMLPFWYMYEQVSLVLDELEREHKFIDNASWRKLHQAKQYVDQYRNNIMKETFNNE